MLWISLCFRPDEVGGRFVQNGFEGSIGLVRNGSPSRVPKFFSTLKPDGDRKSEVPKFGSTDPK